ncbi:hypothetical protein M011DRAFT_461863 [Sporormia fimetaria CBS 119925]|uniref:Uncharacterized protein n=1 Tax=Sporormia fimetaria CBS 119925 TaxID=1340428 RepID=A0A6A6UZR9_9PLEO|nr:hypothetical protein M011DRAFT_461863 [Sporormia fimetaria CBS 119925]
MDSIDLKSSHANVLITTSPTSSPLQQRLLSLFCWHHKDEDSPKQHRSWRPNAYKSRVLFTAALLCWGLIAAVHTLLIRSQRDGGIITIPRDEESPTSLATTFLYLYLPTIIAITLSIFWSWIDLQIKRVEPYYQLSKPGGAPGKDSLLLEYPFDFIPFVPFSAMKDRHWAVFWASTAIVVVTWGLVPVQAGIFTTEAVSHVSKNIALVSTGFMHADVQNTTLNARHLHSAHNIVWFNESLPPYMTREYALAPFKMAHGTVPVSVVNETWTAPTRLYSVDIDCEEAHMSLTPEEIPYWHGDNCSTNAMSVGNNTIGDGLGSMGMEHKEFASHYIGYYSTDFATWYLQGVCEDLDARNRFLALFGRNKQRDEDPPQNATGLFCRSFFYEQEVMATVQAESRAPLTVTPMGPKQAVAEDKLNHRWFLFGMQAGVVPGRGDLPLDQFPSQMQRLANLPLDSWAGDYFPQFAVGASGPPMEKYLDPEGLRASYETAYRILFSRLMVEVLDQDFNETVEKSGEVAFVTRAVTVVPVFAYIVEGLLGFISLCAIVLMWISRKRQRYWKLSSDPSTIASIMSLVAEDEPLLREFSGLDRSNMKDTERFWKNMKFHLHTVNGTYRISATDDSSAPLLKSNSEKEETANPVRPKEFGTAVVLVFMTIQVCIAILLAVLWARSRSHGLPRSSNRALVRQIVENYIPTAVATMIEPAWILFNRLLCMLQPLEELRKGNATPRRSIAADYSSLPPQLSIFRAMRNSHFKLAAVCMMALLANLLAVAFSGLFEERDTVIPRTVTFPAPYKARFSEALGGPEAFSDHWMLAESNYSAGTSLPQWTDDRFFYVPFFRPGAFTGTQALNARTTAFGSSLECSRIDKSQYKAEFFISFVGSDNVTRSFATLDFNLPNSSGGNTTCRMEDQFQNYLRWSYDYPEDSALEWRPPVLARANATYEEQKFCNSTTILAWTRSPASLDLSTWDDRTALFITCKPNMLVGEADVLVDPDGRVLNVENVSTTADISGDTLERYFSEDPETLLRKVDFFQSGMQVWHNDSFASDYMNHFIRKHFNDSRLLDPKLPAPTLQDVTERLYPVYSKIWAIWLATYYERALVPATEEDPRIVTGETHEVHIRLYLSFPLFIVSECILAAYAFVALIIYIGRPGKFLPRLPTSIAAVIGLFAASTAVREFKHTSQLSNRKRRRLLEQSGNRYGYGTFVGADGELHIGIEKHPIVSVAPIPGILKRFTSGLSKSPTYEKLMK